MTPDLMRQVETFLKRDCYGTHYGDHDRICPVCPLVAFVLQIHETATLEQWKKHNCHVHTLPSGAPQPTCACLLCIETAVRAERARCIQTVRDAVVQELPGADTILERIVDALRAEAGETRAECPYCYCYESLTSGCDCGCHK